MRYMMNNADMEWAEEVFAKMSAKLSAECDRIGSGMPYIPVKGRYSDMGREHLNWWTNSFWAGILWQMYHATGEQKYADCAVGLEKTLEKTLEGYRGLDHDLGFLWLHTAVAHYRLLGDVDAQKRGLHAAAIFASRFQPAGNYFRAWNTPNESVAIVDCLMNLPLLYWGSGETGNPAWKTMAMAHADTALEHILRPDGSSNHIVKFDWKTGEILEKPGGQGYGEGSSWTRGHAWAIYGTILSYRYTGRREYLDAAKRTAHYFIANAALDDYNVVIDFRAPRKPVYYDNTAAVCAACGLLELSEHVGEYEKELYIVSALRMLHRITDRFCNWNPEEDGITTAGSAQYHRTEDREVPIIYGDYFLLEAVLRILDKDFMIW